MSHMGRFEPSLFIFLSTWLLPASLFIYASSSSFVSVCSLSLTEFTGSLDVDVVVAAADADNDAQRLELLQVLSGQGDGVVHHGPDCLIQHLRDIREESASTSLSHHISVFSTNFSVLKVGLMILHSIYFSLYWFKWSLCPDSNQEIMSSKKTRHLHPL